MLASNTSTLDIDAIAAVTSRPQMVIGTHFFSPANVMRLVEIVRGKATEKPVIATAMALAKKLKKVGVVVRNGFGFVGNRMMFPYMEQAQFLVEEGATPEQVDRALTDFGMAMGPLAVADLSGIDVFWRIQQEFQLPPGTKQPEADQSSTRRGDTGKRPARVFIDTTRIASRRPIRKCSHWLQKSTSRDLGRRDRRAVHLRADQ